MISKTKMENLFLALSVFIETMRTYIVGLLTKEGGDNWPNWYYDSLGENQKHIWNTGISGGSSPESLIDFGNLKGFSLKYRDLLKKDFGKKAYSLPTWFDEITEVRNKCNHFGNLEEDEVHRAYDNMILVMKHLKKKDDEDALVVYRDAVEQKSSGRRNGTGGRSSAPSAWFNIVTPHLDIRQGRLDESVFAANLAEIVLQNGREIYQNPVVFFSKTYFTQGLTNILKKVTSGLNGNQDAENRVISLQTGFGGGKTHALIALYHFVKLGKKAKDIAAAAELFASVPNPAYDKVNTAVFTNTTNDAIQGRKTNGLHIKTIWGEIAYQLGGKEAYEIIRPNDENRTSPKGLFKKILEKTSPAVILIDELADYCVAASGVTVGGSTLSDQTISFIQEISVAVAASDTCVLVATLPASAYEVANSPQASQILTSLSSRLGRVGADTRPVADEEIFEVIRRRLFEDPGDQAVIDSVVSAYMNLYQENNQEVPSGAVRSEYRERLKKSYPFHPELIDMFRIRWASHHDFQRTRGVLRILASIIADLWDRQGSLKGNNYLIHPSDVSFTNLDALSGQLKKLYGNGYDAVISADVSGSSSNAFKIDQDKREYGKHSLTQGLAASILLGRRQ